MLSNAGNTQLRVALTKHVMTGKMKWIVVVALTLTTVAGWAQSRMEKLDKLYAETTPQERAELQTERMTEKLSLNESQKTQVYDLNLRYAEKMQQTYTGGGGKLQRLKQMRAISQEKDQELKKVLTPEQYALYEKHREEMKEAMRERSREGNG